MNMFLILFILALDFVNNSKQAYFTYKMADAGHNLECFTYIN